jgi:hypothetical protein
LQDARNALLAAAREIGLDEAEAIATVDSGLNSAAKKATQ